MATSAEVKARLHEPHVDLRDWLTEVDAIGELKRIEGVDWNLEMGAVAERVAFSPVRNDLGLQEAG